MPYLTTYRVTVWIEQDDGGEPGSRVALERKVRETLDRGFLNSDAMVMEVETEEDDSICGFCGKHGADKVPHPERWPGEMSAGTELVHAACEDEECGRAHALLTDSQRAAFLRAT